MFRLKAKSRIGVWSLGLVLLTLLVGCDLPLFTASETISEVFETGDAPRVVVETFNGSIDISNGEDDEVVVEVTKRAGGFDQRAAEANLENFEISLAESDNEIRVTVRRMGHTIGNCGASVVIAAPKGAKVDLKTTNGYIVSEGMRGGIDAKTSNGRVDVYEATGEIDAATNNGAIEIEATGAVVDAHTSNGRIRFKGSLTDKLHRFRTSNGAIDLTLPADSQFHVEATTSNGSIDCEFPLDSEASKSRRKLSGTVGDNPDCRLRLSTSNGSIDIGRYRRQAPGLQYLD